MGEKLKEFILKNELFYECAKKYTFMYREFSSFNDCYEIFWNKKEKEWECSGDGYCCHNQNEAPIQKKNTLFLELTIEGFNWGTLFNRMEQQFIENLKEDMSEEDIDDLIENDYERYVQLREDFFNLNKQKIVDEWFEIKEENLQTYFLTQFNKLKELMFIKKIFVY